MGAFFIGLILILQAAMAMRADVRSLTAEAVGDDIVSRGYCCARQKHKVPFDWRSAQILTG